jgi:hypothetical protein
LIISLLIYRGTQRYNQECCNDTGQDIMWQERDYRVGCTSNSGFVGCYTEWQGCWLPKFWRWRQKRPSKCLLLTAMHKSTFPAQSQICGPSKTGQFTVNKTVYPVQPILFYLQSKNGT